MAAERSKGLEGGLEIEGLEGGEAGRDWEIGDWLRSRDWRGWAAAAICLSVEGFAVWESHFCIIFLPISARLAFAPKEQFQSEINLS